VIAVSERGLAQQFIEQGAPSANASLNQQKRPNRLTGALASSAECWRVYSIA
jgi:hypothetical protein